MKVCLVDVGINSVRNGGGGESCKDSASGNHSSDFVDFRATADHKSSSTLKSTKSTASNTANPRILESYIDSQNHKTRCSRSFFSKSTSSDSTLESTFDKSTISLSSQADPLLSSRDFRKEVVAIHKSAQADSSNAADFTTAKKVDSSLEAMDCHAIATALARNDKKNAVSKKVDSKSEAQNLKTPAKDSGIFDKTAQSVFDSHAAGGRIFLKKHRRNLSGVPCFDTNAELQKVDSSKQAQNVSKQPQDSRICDEKPLLFKPRKEIRLAVYRRSAAQKSKVYRAKPNPQAQSQRPNPKKG